MNVFLCGSVAAVCAAAPALAQPQRFAFVLDTQAGSVQLTMSIGVDTHGFWIGNHDPVTNPGGTRTIPGLFGGSGNSPINVAIGMSVAGASTTHPAGSFVMDVNTGTFTIDGLSLDLLGGQTITLPMEVTVLYDTFHTANPSALFPGGVPITIPLGDAEVTMLTAAQSGNGGGTLVPGPGLGEFIVAGVVPTMLTVEASALGSPISSNPLPVALAIAGTLVVSGNSAVLSASTMIDVQQVIPGPIPGPQAAPFALPTVLPPGNAANLLLTLDIDQIDFAFGGTIDLAANGVLGCYADCDPSTGVGRLDIFDFLCFQNAFVAGDATACACDVSSGPLVCDIFDFLCFQNAFVAGCP